MDLYILLMFALLENSLSTVPCDKCVIYVVVCILVYVLHILTFAVFTLFCVAIKK